MDKILLTARYVEGDLNAEEYGYFEENVKYDIELKEYLEYYKYINRSLDIQLMDALMTREVHKTTSYLSKQEKKYSSKNIRIMLSTTLLCLLVATALWIWSPWRNYTYEEFKITDNEMIDQIASLSSYPELYQAAKHVDNEEYYEAKQIIEKLYVKNTNDHKLASQYASILITTDCLATSKEVLYPVFNSEEVGQKYEAAYKIALAYLKEGNKEACKEWLSKMPLYHKRYQQANELIAKIS